MEEKYYVIHNGEGDTTIREYTKEQLLKELDEEGGFYEGIFEGMPSECDTNYWQGKSLIIKGSVVVPTEKAVVTQFDID